MDDSRRTRRLRIAFGALFAASLVGLGWLAWWSERPEVRYAAMACYHQQIYDASGPVEAVVLGTSRAKYGVDVLTLAEGLGLDPATAGVVNGGRGFRGTGQMYRQLLDLDAERGVVGPVAVEFTPEDATSFTVRPPYYQYKPNHAVNVPYADLVEDWRAKPREPAYSRARDLLSHLQLRLDATLQTAIEGIPDRVVVRERDARPEHGALTCLSNPASRKVRRWGRQAATLETRERKVAAQVGESGSWRDLPARSWPLDVVNLDVQDHFIRRFVDFGRERDVPVLLIYVPGYLEAPPSEAYLAAFEERYGQPLLVPPAEVLDELNREGGWYFQDVNHLNRRGHAVYAEWLAGEMRTAESRGGA
jgi:hypothetical protein